MIDDVIYNYSSSIKDWGYMGEKLEKGEKGNDPTKLSDLSRLRIKSCSVNCVSPSEALDYGLLMS